MNCPSDELAATLTFIQLEVFHLLNFHTFQRLLDTGFLCMFYWLFNSARKYCAM